MVSKWGRSHSTHTSNWTVEAFFDLRFSNEMKNVGKMEERGYDIKIESVAKKKYTSPSKNVDFSIWVSEHLQITILFYLFQIIPGDYTTY